MKAVVIARQESGMRWLDNGVSCVPDVFGVECSIEFEAVFDWDLVTQGIVAANGYDEGA